MKRDVRKKGPTSLEARVLEVVVELDQDHDSFLPEVDGFLVRMATALGCPVDSLQLVSVRTGCVLVWFEGPEEYLKYLLLFKEGKLDEIPEAVLKELQPLFTHYKVKMVRTTGVGSAPAILTIALEVDRIVGSGNKKFSWIHISDLHTRAASDPRHWGADVVSTSFVDDVGGLIAKASVQPDCIMFTGDIAFSGTEEQFTEASLFISQVKAQVPSAGSVFAVPGNHDVSRAGVRDEETLRAELDGVETVHTFLMSMDDAARERRRTANQRLMNFSRFVDDNRDLVVGPRVDDVSLSSTTVLPIGDARVAVSSLNSAWRSSDDSDRGRLILGKAQLEKAKRSNDSADLRIGLSHHPLGSDWFAPWDATCQRIRLGAFDILLHGHQHTPGAFTTDDLIGPSRVMTIPAGALYVSPRDRDFYCSFNAVHIDLVQRIGCLWFWRYDRNASKWVLDTTLAEHGFTIFNLPGSTPSVRASSVAV